MITDKEVRELFKEFERWGEHTSRYEAFLKSKGLLDIKEAIQAKHKEEIIKAYIIESKEYLMVTMKDSFDRRLALSQLNTRAEQYYKENYEETN